MPPKDIESLSDDSPKKETPAKDEGKDAVRTPPTKRPHVQSDAEEPEAAVMKRPSTKAKAKTKPKAKGKTQKPVVDDEDADEAEPVMKKPAAKKTVVEDEGEEDEAEPVMKKPAAKKTVVEDEGEEDEEEPVMQKPAGKLKQMPSATKDTVKEKKPTAKSQAAAGSDTTTVAGVLVKNAKYHADGRIRVTKGYYARDGVHGLKIGKTEVMRVSWIKTDSL